MNGLDLATIAFFIVLAIAIFLYFRPNFIREGFATIALDDATMPKCFLRDTEAQRLISMFQNVRKMPTASEPAMALAELTLILQKALCIDADVTGSGAGPYSTYQLPFATAHDIEPAASFVGRCLRNAIRSRDIEVAMDKFERRGAELINTLCTSKENLATAQDMFHNIMVRATRNISEICLKPQAQMDVPAGPRDPGYFTPESVDSLRPYTIRGGYQYF